MDTSDTTTVTPGTSTTAARRHTLQLRVLAIGLALGVACMVALGVAGIASSTPGLVVAASSGFAALAGAFTTAFVVVRKQRSAAA